MSRLTPNEAFAKRAFTWSGSFIREQIDTEGKFIADAEYSIKGQDLRRALVAAYAAGKHDCAEHSPLKDLVEAAQSALDMIKSCGFGGSNGKAELRIERELRLAISKAQAPLRDQGHPGASGISPNAGPTTELVAESSDGPANSSDLGRGGTR